MKNLVELKRELSDRIEVLLEESYTLKRTRDSWPRHVEIQAEIMQLCRRLSDLHGDAQAPYWQEEAEAETEQSGRDEKAA